MTDEQRKPLRLAAVVGMMFNPGGVLKEHMQGLSWGAALGLSGTAFAVFFLQTGIDMVRTGKAGAGAAVGLVLMGAVYGTVGIALVGVIGWAASRPFSGQHPPSWAIKAYSLAYCPALVYGVCGLAVSVALGWRTAVAFGVTGVLWAIGPMMAVNEELTGGKRLPAMVISAICGGLVLLGWAKLGAGG